MSILFTIAGVGVFALLFVIGISAMGEFIASRVQDSGVNPFE